MEQVQRCPEPLFRSVFLQVSSKLWIFNFFNFLASPTTKHLCISPETSSFSFSIFVSPLRPSVCFFFVWLGFSVHADINTEIICSSCEGIPVCQPARWVTCENRIPPHGAHAFSWQRKASERQTLPVVLEPPET